MEKNKLFMIIIMHYCRMVVSVSYFTCVAVKGCMLFVYFQTLFSIAD